MLKKINGTRTGTYVIVCVLKSFLGPSWSSCLAIMAMKPWMDLVKKHEKVESGPPAKVLCTPYEKQLKKMPGDLTVMKETSEDYTTE